MLCPQYTASHTANTLSRTARERLTRDTDIKHQREREFREGEGAGCLAKSCRGLQENVCEVRGDALRHGGSAGLGRFLFARGVCMPLWQRVVLTSGTRGLGDQARASHTSGAGSTCQARCTPARLRDRSAMWLRGFDGGGGGSYHGEEGSWRAGVSCGLMNGDGLALACRLARASTTSFDFSSILTCARQISLSSTVVMCNHGGEAFAALSTERARAASLP